MENTNSSIPLGTIMFSMTSTATIVEKPCETETTPCSSCGNQGVCHTPKTEVELRRELAWYEYEVRAIFGPRGHVHPTRVRAFIEHMRSKLRIEHE